MKRIPSAAAAVLAFVLPGCVSLTTYQTPHVLEPGQITVGAGVSGVVGEEGAAAGLLDVFGRYGLGRAVDVGLQFSGVPAVGVVKADVKYQLLRGPVAVAADLGASFSGVDEYSTFAIYPMILAGTDRVHAGVKGTYFTTAPGDGDDFWANASFLPSIVVGASIPTGSVRFLPEVNVFFGDEVAAVAGIGVQFLIR